MKAPILFLYNIILILLSNCDGKLDVEVQLLWSKTIYGSVFFSVAA